MIKILFVFLSLCFIAFTWTSCEKEPPAPEATSLLYVYGNNQSAYITQQLSDSLVVMVKDNKGEAFPGVEISFQVDSNTFGTLSSNLVTTDNLGKAFVHWTLGSHIGNQTVTAYADSLTGSPIVFTAEGFAWMQDNRDGKIYRTVTISTQRWLAENLDYNTSGSWGNPNNPTSVYGRLYDWATANIVCPPGWHLPSDAEWIILETAIGGSNVGTHLKSNSDW
ncbi:MAG: hypothetical protein MK207_14130, partial [Saprospiraceae bacterium]|nr:hypothetical protein [Saprospiraceae bacterium]